MNRTRERVSVLRTEENEQSFVTVRACDGSAALRQPRKKASEKSRVGAAVRADRSERILCAGAPERRSVVTARPIASTRAHRFAAHAASETRRIPRGSTLKSTSRRTRDLYPRGAGAVPPETSPPKDQSSATITSAACVPLGCVRIRAPASILRTRVLPHAPSRAFARCVARAPRPRLGQTTSRDEKKHSRPFPSPSLRSSPAASSPPPAPARPWLTVRVRSRASSVHRAGRQLQVL